MRAAFSRLLQSLISIWVVTGLAFLALALLPGEPFAELGADSGIPPERVEALRRIHTDDRPLPQRYLSWSLALLRGDLGTSIVRSRPVGELILEVLKLRREKAKLLGYADFADLVLEDRMAERGEKAGEFVDELREDRCRQG